MQLGVWDAPHGGRLARRVRAEEKRRESQSCLLLTSRLHFPCVSPWNQRGGVKVLCEDPQPLCSLPGPPEGAAHCQKDFLTLKPKGPQKGRPWGLPDTKTVEQKQERARQGLGPPPPYLVHAVGDLRRAGRRPRALHGQHILQQLLTACGRTDRQCRSEPQHVASDPRAWGGTAGGPSLQEPR